ncbi:MAG: hypothetical protein NTW19_15040 [Planctomycetota bacterium]|nr:hypothetical protein [Planctomycetota bacterium]
MTQPNEPQSQPPTDLKLHCLKCGYNLTGLSTQVCPECGRPFTWAELTAAAAAPKFNHGAMAIASFFLPPAIVAALIAFIALTPGGIPGSGTVLLGGLQLALLFAVVGSFYRGRYFARRLARKLPSDPPTPATVGMTLVYGVASLALQAMLILFVLASLCSGRIGH